MFFLKETNDQKKFYREDDLFRVVSRYLAFPHNVKIADVPYRPKTQRQ